MCIYNAVLLSLTVCVVYVCVMYVCVFVYVCDRENVSVHMRVSVRATVKAFVHMRVCRCVCLCVCVCISVCVSLYVSVRVCKHAHMNTRSLNTNCIVCVQFYAQGYRRLKENWFGFCMQVVGSEWDAVIAFCRVIFICANTCGHSVCVGQRCIVLS